MKKVISFIFVISLSLSTTLGYQLNTKEEKQVNEAKEFIQSLATEKKLNWFESKIKSFKYASIKYQRNEKISYVLDEIKNELEKVYENKTNEIENKKLFVEKYWKDIASWMRVHPRCLEHYDFVDKVARENNFPTALILATWYREHSCLMTSPSNWQWAFQIVSQRYEPWEISKDDLEEKIINFIEFSKAKWDYWEQIKYNWSLPERFWTDPINISYDDFTLRDVRLQSILYNWMTQWSTLEVNRYTNTNMSEEINQKLKAINPNTNTNRDWVATMFIKLLNWEIENK